MMASETTTTAQRPYRKRLRAEQEEETRERITEAAVRLHGTVGPARTTISGVAEEAGVQRATVYRHFPTEADLFDACSSHYAAEHPSPDVEAWREIRDPGARLRRGLADYYDYYAETEPMFEKVFRDAPVVPAMAKPVLAGAERRARAVDALMSGRTERGAARRRVRAAVTHALWFPTWQSLVRFQGLEESEAVAVMAAMVEAAGSARPRASA
jgi:AcrR family transcriptional regulator